MAGNSKRAIVQLESTAGTGYRYTVTKSKKNHPGRIEYKKFDPVLRKHVLFKETKYLFPKVIAIADSNNTINKIDIKTTPLFLKFIIYIWLNYPQIFFIILNEL